jgi:HK97 family phage major capsid protein
MTITDTATVRIPAGLEFDPATDPQRRRHLVLAMPWGAQVDPRHAESGGHVLERGDVLVDPDLARQGFVNVDHEVGDVGTIVAALEDDIGIWAVVDLTEEGERVFAAGNGDVSAEIIQPGLRWYFSGLALISPGETPAIPGSRVLFSNKRYRTYAVRTMEVQMTNTATEATPTTGTPPAANAPSSGDFQAFTTQLAEKLVDSHKQLTEGLTKSLGDSVSAAFKTALEALPNPQGEQGPGEVRAARFQVTREEPVYAFNGTGHSLVRDAWYSARERDHDATERIRKYRLQSEEVAKLAAHQVATQAFTASSTSTAGQIIPPGYRPDLYVPQLQQGRPLVGMASQGVIANATPFTVPVFTSVTGASGDHVEGTNPTDGTLSFGTKTVTPGAIDGKLILTREIVDSSNPAIDQIALAAMRESYARQTEGKVYTLLNGANGAGGVITSGFVPSGSQASTYVGSTGTPPAAIAGIRKELARYPFNRFQFPTMAAIGQNAAQIISGAVDTTGRPMFPWTFGGPNNAPGVQQPGGYLIDNLLFVPAWSVSGVAAGDSQILIGNQADLWVWESPLLTFRFEEKSGPANIELALFGYFGTHLLRPVGLSGIRLT